MSNKTQRTAVEQFANYLLKHKQSNSINGIDYVLIQVNEVEQLKKQAKEIDKEQKSKDCKYWEQMGVLKALKVPNRKTFEQYYEETYGGKNEQR